MAAPVPPNKNRPRLINVRHPFYAASIRNWRKWRLCYEGGDRFIEAYLRHFSKREDDQDFLDRKSVTQTLLLCFQRELDASSNDEPLDAN